MKSESKLVQVQDKLLLETFRSNDYNKTRTAKALGCGLRTAQRRLTELGVPYSDVSVRYSDAKPEIVKCVDKLLKSMPDFQV